MKIPRTFIPNIMPGTMKTISAALFVISLLVATSAYAKCMERQCSVVKMKVVSCEAAALKSDGTLSSSPSSAEARGEISGYLLHGRSIAEHAAACYPGLPAKYGATDNKGQDFFVQLTDLSCKQLIGKVIVGQTAHPCCDIPPLPGETYPGTCNTETRLLNDVRIFNDTRRR